MSDERDSETNNASVREAKVLRLFDSCEMALREVGTCDAEPVPPVPCGAKRIGLWRWKILRWGVAAIVCLLSAALHPSAVTIFIAVLLGGLICSNYHSPQQRLLRRFPAAHESFQLGEFLVMQRQLTRSRVLPGRTYEGGVTLLRCPACGACRELDFEHVYACGALAFALDETTPRGSHHLRSEYEYLRVWRREDATETPLAWWKLRRVRYEPDAPRAHCLSPVGAAHHGGDGHER